MICKHYLELAKIRVTAMVLMTTAVGYILAAPRPIDWTRLGWVVLGTALAAAGASALNQLLEIDRDAKMERTRGRPLPSGQISRPHALAFALVTGAAGILVLNERVNPLTAALGLANLLVYAALYTPLKPRTSTSTLVGAVCGAVPPLMGWAAAGRGLSLGAALLGTTLLLWQVPHSLSFVWLYRADYMRAGYRMLPVIDSSGRLTCLAIVLYALALMPLGLAVTFFGRAGCLFGAASLALGLGFFLLALQLHTSRARRHARRVFWASLAYLPLLLAVWVADAAKPQAAVPFVHAGAKPQAAAPLANP
ncbi:MAG: heme o synthase [Thermoguttaceae bacterium]|jgi:protoheme IX farnesyltransferase